MSLILLVQEEVGSLIYAKKLVEQVLAGDQVEISFDNAERERSFWSRAEDLGAILVKPG